MTQEKLVSIIIPVYNAADRLAIGVGSILRQTSDAYEVIVVDDGSTDGTAERARELLAPCPRSLVLTQANAGSGAARNLGVDHATGDYLYFMDDDDEIEPELVETILESMECGCDLLVFGYRAFTPDGALTIDAACQEAEFSGAWLREHFDQVLFEKAPRFKKLIIGAPWNKAFLRRAVMEHGVRYPDLRRNQDEVFMMRYISIVERVRYIPRQLYRHHLNSIESIWRKYPLDYMSILLKNLRYRVELMVGWNPENADVVRYVVLELSGVSYLAFKQIMNPKHALNLPQRLRHLARMRAQYRAVFRKDGLLHAGRAYASRFILYAPLPLLYRRVLRWTPGYKLL